MIAWPNQSAASFFAIEFVNTIMAVQGVGSNVWTKESHLGSLDGEHRFWMVQTSSDYWYRFHIHRIEATSAQTVGQHRADLAKRIK